MAAESIYQLRLLLIAPLAKAVTLATWINGNIAVNSVSANLGPGLSADGNEPATHNICCLSLTLQQGRLVLNRICTLAGQPTFTVAAWNALTKAQKKATVDGLQQTIWDQYGVYFDFSDNQGTWRPRSEALAFLTANGVTLKQIGIEE